MKCSKATVRNGDRVYRVNMDSIRPASGYRFEWCISCDDDHQYIKVYNIYSRDHIATLHTSTDIKAAWDYGMINSLI